MHYVNCHFCAYKVKSVPVYAAHAQMRVHMQERHPNEFLKLLLLEKQIRAEAAALVDRYGYAVKPLRMNL